MLGRCVHGVCRSREEAFKIGTEIAREVTASNPPPVTLKFEKVYHPCVLLTKKRYVGYMYESPSQVGLQHICAASTPGPHLPPACSKHMKTCLLCVLLCVHTLCVFLHGLMYTPKRIAAAKGRQATKALLPAVPMLL